MLTYALKKLFQNKNQIWTFYAQIAKLFSGFVFIVLLARKLPSDLLGTWYIFVSLFGVASLVEMGLSQVIGRHAAYLNADYAAGKVTSADFLKIAKIGERLYLFLAIFIMAVALPIGLWKFGHSNAKMEFSTSLVSAWVVYVLGGGMTLLGAYYSAWVNGVGQMWKTQRTTILSTGLSITILMSLLIFPSNLLVPAAAMFFSQIFLVIMQRKAFYTLDIIKVALLNTESAQINARDEMQNIAKDASKMLMVMVAYQLLTNGFVLILSSYCTKSDIASYGLTMQMITVAISISMIWAQSNFYEMAATRNSINYHVLRKLFFDSLARSSGVALCGMICIYYIAQFLLESIGTKTTLLQPVLLAIVLGSAWFEFTLGQISQLSIAKGDMRVVYLSLLTAIAVSGLTVLLLSAEFNLTSIFLVRICLFVILFGIPVINMSRKFLRVSYTK